MAKLQMLMPQEIEVYYIIPTIRSHLTKHLKDQGMSQKEIAKILCIQESTVSQYVSNKRASQISFTEPTEIIIKEAAARIKDKLDLIRETQSILRTIRNSREICEIHKKLSDVPAYCDAGQMGCDHI